MTQEIKLNAKEREELGKKSSSLREKGIIPAVLYGKNVKNQNLSLDVKEFTKVYQAAGESTLVDLKIGDKESTKVVVQDVQIDPVSDSFVHIDLYQVNMKEKMTTEIEIELTGEAPAKKKGGIIETVVDELEVKCLPQDLISKIVVDISGLNEIDDVIRLKDLDIPETLEINEDPQRVIVSVSRPTEEVVEEPKETEEGAEGEGEDGAEEGKEEKKDGAEEGKEDKKDDSADKKEEK